MMGRTGRMVPIAVAVTAAFAGLAVPAGATVAGAAPSRAGRSPRSWPHRPPDPRSEVRST